MARRALPRALAGFPLAGGLAGTALLGGCSCGIGWGGAFCARADWPPSTRPAPWVYSPLAGDGLAGSGSEPPMFCRTDGSECALLDDEIRREIARGRPR